MTVIDRYLLKQFIKIFLICMVSIVGLFTVIHIFTNLDEVGAIAEQDDGFKKLLFEFYGPRSLDLFNRMAGILILAAAIFAVTMLQRRRELTAIQAAGITKARVVRPVIFAALAIILISLASRELAIPKMRHLLVRSVNNWTEKGTLPFSFHKDHQSGLLIKGSQLEINSQKIFDASIELPIHLGKKFSIISGEAAVIREPKGNFPGGVLINNVFEPDKLSQRDSVYSGNQKIVYMPKDHQWLAPDQVFVVCKLNVDQIAYGSQMTKYSSIPEIMSALERPSRKFVSGDKVLLHERILQPLMELTLLLLALPLVVARANTNIFLAAGICLMIVVLVQCTMMAAHTMGAFHMVRPAALAAWLPVLIFLPFSAVSIGKLYQ